MTTKLLNIFMLLLITGCALIQRAPFGKKAVYNATSSSISVSLNEIDSHPTYELFFMLNEKESEIKASINGQIINAAGSSVEGRFFFIIEKKYDTSSSDSIYTSYIELGRNFDNSWNSSESVQISSGSDGLTSLDPGIYRIRITIFSDNIFDCKISLFTSAKEAHFSDKAVFDSDVSENKD
ncbi:MAG TPA: hypothetical protein P5123_01555 [Spirochaetota bacterium]|nr:hypothetical protein [Spirochaetota bacterium]